MKLTGFITVLFMHSMSYGWTISTTWWETARVMMPMGMVTRATAMKMVIAQLGVMMGFHAGSSCCVNSVCFSLWNMVRLNWVSIDNSPSASALSSSKFITAAFDDDSPSSKWSHWFGVEDSPVPLFAVKEPLSREISPSIPTAFQDFCILSLCRASLPEATKSSSGLKC